MIKPELYKRTTDILYQAYFKDLLRHNDCDACAVGNICAGNGVPRLKGGQMSENNYYNSASWGMVFMTGWSEQQVYTDYINPGSDNYKEAITRVIKATGYSWTELAKIEFAFETAKDGIYNPEDQMFAGLVAVLEVLRDIHQVTDQDLLTSNNNRFKEQYERRAVKIVL